MALGDNVFQVQPREGYGTATIFGPNPALQHLMHQKEVDDARDYETGKALQDQIAQLATATKNALPLHIQELTNQYKDILGWHKDMKQKGFSFKNGSNEALDLQLKFAELQGEASKAQMYKERAVGLMKEYQPDKHEQDSYVNAQKYLNETPLDKIDVRDIPQLENQLNSIEYQKKIGADLKDQTEWNYKNAIDLGNGNKMVTGRKYQDPEAATNLVMDDNSKTGQKYKNLYYNKFLNLPQKEQEIIVNELSKKNISVKEDKNVLKNAATAYMVKNSFNNVLKDEQINKAMQNYEYLAALKGDKNPPITSQSTASTNDSGLNNFAEQVIKAQNIKVKDRDGNDVILNDPNSNVVVATNAPEGTNAGAMFRAAQKGLVDAAVRNNAKVTTVTDDKGKSIDIDGKTFDGKNITFLTIGNKTYFVGNAASLTPTEIDRLGKDHGTDVEEKLKKQGIYDLSNTTFRNTLRGQNAETAKFIDGLGNKSSHTNNSTPQIKEINGTQQQLDDAAKKKGMSTEKYIKTLKNNGYKVKVDGRVVGVDQNEDPLGLRNA